MENIEDIVRMNSLYDIYKNLLTEKQKEYYEAFYFDNLSLSEIAEIHNVSRNAIHSQLKLTVESLENLESKLNLFEKNIKQEELFDKIKSLTNDKKIIDLLNNFIEEQ